ncbi:hypothetical protein ACP70R_035132 [Stipagrostis hirtigluma subsp. patula]
MASSRNPDPSPAPAPPPAFAPAAEAEAGAPNPSAPPGDPPSPEMEATAEALTREEVLRRRRRRAARLAGIYRRLYWSMAEEVRARHRQYVWDLGRSPLESEQPPPPPAAAPGGGEAPRPAAAAVPRRKKCGFTGCKVRAMAMARFCHSHILSDPKQALYKPCAFVTKSVSQTGQIICGRPIIKSASPALCNIHLQRCQKNIAQAYKKVGFNPPLTGKISPKFSVLVAECVRQIQAKRRESLSAAARQKCPKDGKVD